MATFRLPASSDAEDGAVGSGRPAAILGFAFVAAWIGFGFGDAVLCLVGAAIFYAIASVL